MIITLLLLIISIILIVGSGLTGSYINSRSDTMYEENLGNFISYTGVRFGFIIAMCGIVYGTMTHFS